MKNLKAPCLVLLILLTGNIVNCQKIFREGYVIKRNGEPLYGLVEYSSNQNIPSICTFKRFDIAREVTYSPETILAFGYKSGNRYESKNLRGNLVFFEVLVTGKIILYQRGSAFYIEKGQVGFVELTNGDIRYLNDSGLAESKSLREFLVFITEGKPVNIPEKINLKSDIVPIVSSYDKNIGQSYAVFNRTMTEKQITKKALETGVNKTRFGILSGVNIYMLNIKPSSAASNYLPNPEKEICPVFGLTYERLISRKTDRLSLRIDLLYAEQTFYCYKEGKNSLGYITRDDAFFGFTGIKAPLSFQYSFTGKRVVPFINAGVAYQYIYKKNYYQIEEVERSVINDINTYEYRNSDFKAGEVSVLAGLGTRIRMINNLNLTLQGRIEMGTGVFSTFRQTIQSSETPFKQNSVQTTLLIGLTF
jgi:hypothetical protein